ncbi:unnamed protein product [Mytilus edulis]|uniref:Uncharacterized protein n=1 Tax=Mytilus edulis TaxID=6550 RepID=A0A8S3U613_MYTED|nr:unnamed protein product [Mytilus edulis]
MGLTDVAFTIKLAFYFTLFGFVLHTIGFGAPYWYAGFNTHAGLWQYCSRSTGVCVTVDISVMDRTRYNCHAGLWQYCSRSTGVCVTIDISVMDRTQVDKFLAVRVLECFGLTGSVACLISICLLIFGGMCLENRFITMCNMFLFLATGTVIVIATIMFATMIILPEYVRSFTFANMNSK